MTDGKNALSSGLSTALDSEGGLVIGVHQLLQLSVARAKLIYKRLG
jgi:hypothetical protein